MNQSAAINEYAQQRRQRSIADTARKMATEGKSKQEVVDYLVGENFPQSAAAADVLFGQVVAMDEAKKKARNAALGTILFGVALTVFGFVASPAALTQRTADVARLWAHFSLAWQWS